MLLERNGSQENASKSYASVIQIFESQVAELIDRTQDEYRRSKEQLIAFEKNAERRLVEVQDDIDNLMQSVVSMSDGEEALVQELENLRTENARYRVFIDFLTHVLGRQIIEEEATQRTESGQSSDLGDLHEEKLDSSGEAAYQETDREPSDVDERASQRTLNSVRWQILVLGGIGCVLGFLGLHDKSEHAFEEDPRNRLETLKTPASSPVNKQKMTRTYSRKRVSTQRLTCPRIRLIKIESMLAKSSAKST